MVSENRILLWQLESCSQTGEVGQLYGAILTTRREYTSFKNLELVWEIFLSTFSDNKSKVGWILWLCSAVLHFNRDRFHKLVGTRNPVDTTDEPCILWKTELSRERCFDMNLALIYFRRKSIFWKMYFKAKFTPFKALGFASVCEGCVSNNLNTTQVAWRSKCNVGMYKISLLQELDIHTILPTTTIMHHYKHKTCFCIEPYKMYRKTFGHGNFIYL